MGGRFAPVNPLEVARLYAIADPPRSPYRQGLSAFPEYPGAGRLGAYARAGFGDVNSDLQIGGQVVGATVAGGPVAGGVVLIKDLASQWSSGSTRDAQRAARANYVGNIAVAGNVAAAQIILGALAPNVSGNELPMWQVWENQLTATTLAAARAAGPYWPVGSTDTVTNYPTLKTFIQNWANAHPSVTGPAGSVASGSALPWILGAAAVGAVLLLKRRGSI
jgi:hypothetical protein